MILEIEVAAKFEFLGEELVSEGDGGLEGELEKDQETKQWERAEEEEERETDVTEE